MKPKIPNSRKANIEHKKRTERYAQIIQEIYDRVAQQAARKASLIGYDPGKPFSFEDYPMTRREIVKLQMQMISDVTAVIMAGTSNEWKESNLVQDLVARKVLTAYTDTDKLGEEYTRYFQTNPDALKAFQQRKAEGMNLAQRVWKLSEQYRAELEESISAAIAPGTSAMELAAEVKKYLKEPDKRFRRIKEKMEDGTFKWHLSKNAKAYHPGRGVYRSSARNAQRLARTEINMAYRTAEQTRWRQFDFVVGYEVKTTQNGMHIEDICDQLAGKYPKDFVFTGWHPQCMCYTIPILKTEDEFWELYGDKPSVNEVTDVPDNFKEWIRENSGRIAEAEKRGGLPYFIKDNMGHVDEARKSDHERSKGVQLSPHYGAAMKLGRSATKEAMKVVENIGMPELTEVQKANIRELAQSLGISRKDIKPMSFLDADQGASNPMKDIENCQSVVVAFEARRRGLNVYALPYSSDPHSASYALGERFQDAWLNPKTGKVMEPTIIKGKNDEEIISKLKKQLNADGRYILGINSKDGSGHVVSLDRIDGHLILKDEQENTFSKIESLEKVSYLEILRIDKAILNISKVKSIFAF